MILRLADIHDIQFVWDCRQALSNPNVKQSNQAESFSGHKQWMTHALSDQNKLFLIIEQNQTSVGYLRFDPDTKMSGWRVSIALMPTVQGSGHGKRILSVGCTQAETAGFTPLIADIHTKNLASQAIFSSCAFVPIHNNGMTLEFTRYIRKLPTSGDFP